MNTSKTWLKKAIVFLVVAAMAITLFPFVGLKTAETKADGERVVPDHSKTRVPNGDGTYQLSLDVTGDADTEATDAKANILVVMDVSGSMTNNDSRVYTYTETTGTSGTQYGYYNGRYVELTYYNGVWYRETFGGYARYNGTRYLRTQTRRADAAEKVVYDFADALYEYNKTPGADNVEMSIVAFSSGRRDGNYNNNGTESSSNPGTSTTGAWLVQNWTNNESTFLNNLSSTGTEGSRKLKYGGGTNWEAAMQRALAVLGTADADPTYVVFVTDGKPTFYVTGGNGSDTTWREYRGPNDEVLNIENYNTADHSYTTPANNNTTLYGIYAYGTEADYLDDLIYYAQNGQGRPGGESADTVATNHYYNASDEAGLRQAINEIFAAIIETLGVGSVAITDGTTTNVETAQGVSHLLAVEPNTYDYWLTIPVSGNGPYTTTRKDPVTGNEYTITFTETEDGSFTATWEDSTGTHEVQGIEGSASLGKFKYHWTEANDLYKYAPPEARYDDSASAVKWDLSGLGTLLDKVTYTVTFNVYPTQETYDLIADLDNGTKTYETLDPAITQYLKKESDGSYTLETNTTTDLAYVDTRVDDEVQHVPFVNPPRVATAVQKMDVTKRWFNDLDWRGQGQYADGFEMDVTRDGVVFDKVTVKPDDWSDQIYISTGLMRVHRNEDNQITGIEVLDTGHDYTLKEPANMTEHWDLVIETLHPMLINGVLHSLVEIKTADIPAGMGDADFYTLEEVDFYRIGDKVFKDNGFNAEDTASVSAYNERKSNLNITKTITGNVDAAPEDAKFTYTLSITDPTGADIWFSVVTDPENPTETLVKDLETTATAEEGNTGYYYFPSGTSVTVKMQAGWNLRVVNMHTYSTYTVEESDTMDPGFTFDNVDGTTQFKVGGLPDGAVDLGSNQFTYDGVIYTKVSDTEYTAVYRPTITGKKVEGKIVSANAPYQITYANKYTPTKVAPKVTKKVTGWDAKEAFNFSIEAGDAATTRAITAGDVVMPASPTVTTGTGMKDGDTKTVSFGDITFNKIGTYTFTVKETNTTAPAGWTYANKDTDAKTITVEITSGENGLVAAVTGDNPTFENSYQAGPAKAQIPVTKIITPENSGADPIDGKFTFTLAAGTNTAGAGITTPMPSSDTVVCGADGVEVKFGEISFAAPGTYTYTVKESVTGDAQATSKDGIELATKDPVTVTVVVTDDGSGTLSAVVNGGATLEFRNPYKVTEIPITIPVQKILSFEDGLNAPDITGKFTFTLATTDGAPLPRVTQLTNPSATGGEMTFGDKVTTGEIIITGPGTYTYTVTETGKVDGVTNADPATQTITVTVTDNGDGTLTPSFSIPKAVFTNTYTVKPTSASIPVEKILSVGEGLEAPEITDEFTFTLTAKTTGAPMPETTSYTNPEPDGGDMTFGAIGFDKPGEYTYTVTETGEVDGVSAVGPTSKDITINVVDNGNGTLTATVGDGTGSPLTFTNEYKVGETTAVIPVNKILEAADGLEPGSIANKFTFTLEAGSNTAAGGIATPMPQTTSYTNPDPKGGKVTFGSENDPITYNAPGTYTYTVKETGSAPGVMNDPTATKTVTVVVSDNSNGTLTAVVNGGEELDFTNTYNVKSTTVSFPVKKELKVPEGTTGPNIKEKYTIALQAGTNTAGEGVDTPIPEVTSYMNPDSDGGVVTFGSEADPITFSKPGTYYYTVSENGNVPGVSNDSAASGKTVTVTVKDNGDGTLTATADSTTADPVKFVNTYSYGSITATPAVHKDLVAADGLTPPDITNKYTFTLAGKNGAPMPEKGGETVTNPAADGGTVNFGTITFAAPGVYEYEVTEAGTVAGVTNDKVSPKTFKVTVTDNKDGTLSQSIDYGNDQGHVVFTNTYSVEDTTVSFPVQKIMSVPEGLDGPKSWSYSIDVKAEDGAPEAATMKGTVTKDNDTVTFGPFTYDKPGTYTYTVSETGKVDGVENDAEAAGKTVTVTVTDNKDGTLKAEASATEKSPLTFTNTYKVESVKASFPVEKILTVPEGLKGPEKWSYDITVAGTPEATVMTGKVDQDNRTITFGDFEFTKPGTYTYTVSEAGTIDGVTNDAAAAGKTVTIEVKDNGDGTLKAEASATEKSPLQFTNTYNVQETTVKFPVKKVLSVPEGFDGPKDWSYTINVEAQKDAPKAETMTGTVTKNQPSAEFGPFTYKVPGTYTYKVSEVGELAGVTNDKDAAGKIVTVTVKDNGNGTLTATADATTASPLTFTNTYEVKEPVTASIPVEKILSVPEGRTAPDITGKFTFKLEAGANTAKVEGTTTPMPETTELTNPAADGGKMAFGKIEYKLPGEYTYTVTESGKVIGVVNDAQAEKTVKVTVTDNGDGTLSAAVNGGEPLQFTNDYKVVDLIIEKDISTYQHMEGEERSATIIFRVTATMDGWEDPVYDNYFSVTMTGADTQQIKLEGLIPEGADVTVEETYTGAGFDAAEGSQTKQEILDIKGTEAVKVSFENEYTDQNKGHGIENRYEYKDGKWQKPIQSSN